MLFDRDDIVLFFILRISASFFLVWVDYIEKFSEKKT